MDLYTAYRRMFATLDDETVVWWYCGGVVAPREGVGAVPQVQAETIMAFRTRDIADDAFTIDWTEVGYFRDIATGEPLDGWFNPFSQQLEPYPKSFVDGPATFTVRRTAEGLDVQLVQHQALVEGVALAWQANTASLGLVQTESKKRAFHRPDGSQPAFDSPEATAIETVLSIWSPQAALADPAQRNLPARGFYRSGSRSGAGGGWAATQVSGVMVKARADERLNPIAWQRLLARYPDFFSPDGSRVAPRFG